jgi:hypothetical protein
VYRLKLIPPLFARAWNAVKAHWIEENEASFINYFERAHVKNPGCLVFAFVTIAWNPKITGL